MKKLVNHRDLLENQYAIACEDVIEMAGSEAGEDKTTIHKKKKK